MVPRGPAVYNLCILFVEVRVRVLGGPWGVVAWGSCLWGLICLVFLSEGIGEVRSLFYLQTVRSTTHGHFYYDLKISCPPRHLDDPAGCRPRQPAIQTVRDGVLSQAVGRMSHLWPIFIHVELDV